MSKGMTQKSLRIYSCSMKEGVKMLDYPGLVKGVNDFREEGFEIVLGVPEVKCFQGSDRAG